MRDIALGIIFIFLGFDFLMEWTGSTIQEVFGRTAILILSGSFILMGMMLLSKKFRGLVRI